MRKNRFSGRHWIIILFGFLLYYCYTAGVADGMNVILPRLAEENHFEYEVLLSMTTVAGMVSVIAVALLGKLCVVLGARKMITISALASAVFFFLYSRVTSLPMFIFALCGVISCFCSFAFIGGGALIANWFPTKKGIASGYAAIGAPVSSMTSLTIYTSAFRSLGFKPTMTLASVIMVVFAVICFLVLRDTPEECGKFPDSIPPEERTAEELAQISPEKPTVTTRSLIRTPQVWMIAVLVGIYSMVLMGLLSQFVVRHQEIPVSESQAILMFSVASAIGLISGPVWGGLENRLGTKKAFILCVLAIIFGMAINFTNYMPLVWVSLIFFGSGATGTHVFLTS